jgi:hypothetical protein
VQESRRKGNGEERNCAHMGFINVVQIAEALMLPLTKKAFFLKVNKIPDRPS